MITSPALRPPVTRLRYSLRRVPDSDRWLLIGIQGALTWYVSHVDATSNWEAEMLANDITGEELTWTRPKTSRYGLSRQRSDSNEITEGGKQ